jgi:hypothetical protein
VYDAAMLLGRFLTSLVLACSLVLVLPRGWCCILAALAAKADPAVRSCCLPGKGKAEPAKRACCRTGEQPQENDHPPGRPMPAESCPCAGRNATLPDHPELPPADLLPCTGAADLPPPLPVVCAFVEPPASWMAHSPSARPEVPLAVLAPARRTRRGT